jgi:hypothetical protein
MNQKQERAGRFGALARSCLKIEFQGRRNFNDCRRVFKLKIIGSILCLCGIFVLFILTATGLLQSEMVLAQGFGEDTKKETKDPKKNSPGFEFEDEKSAMCLSAERQSKQVASIVEAYARRLGACATSSPNFRADCSIDFRRLVSSYSQYELAVSSVRNYCK